MTISLDTKTEKLVRDLAKRRHGDTKGAISTTIKEGVEKLAEEVRLESIRHRAIERLEKGFKLGFIGYHSRDELYDDRIRKQLPRH